MIILFTQEETSGGNIAFAVGAPGSHSWGGGLWIIL